MITILPIIINDVVLTLTELQTIANPSWLFEFTNDLTGTVKLFTAQDISTATCRYNRFNITNTTIENPYNGEMNFTPAGYWSYKVYQMNSTSPVDLNPVNAISIVETGKVLVKEITTTIPTFTTNDTINNVVFDM